MRFWMVFWSFVFAYFCYESITTFGNNFEMSLVYIGLTAMSLYMWLYTFIRIIVVDFVPIILAFIKSEKIFEIKDEDESNE